MKRARPQTSRPRPPDADYIESLVRDGDRLFPGGQRDILETYQATEFESQEVAEIVGQACLRGLTDHAAAAVLVVFSTGEGNRPWRIRIKR